MFDYEQPPSEDREPTDYTGLIFAAILAPVFLVFIYLHKADMGLTVFIILGMVLFAIKIRWNLRKHFWFWAAIALVLLLHIPLFFVVRWPQNNIPTIAYSMPLGVIDFLLIVGAIGIAEKIFSRDSLPDAEE